MAEFTSLNGYDVKDKKAVRVYDNVEAMKEDYSIQAGQTVQTLGFYENNDGGSAEYMISDDNTLTPDESLIIQLDNNLFAKLIIKNNTINVKQLGAYGDATHNDTAAIQKAIDNFSNVFIPDGTYMINNEINISNVNERIINGEKNTIINSNSTTHLFLFNQCNNITIRNISFTSPSQYENGSSSTNYIAGFTNCKYILIKDTQLFYARQGYSFMNCSGIKFQNNVLHDTTGWGCYFGMLNNVFGYIEDTEIYNNITYNGAYDGIKLSGYIKNINIHDNISYSNTRDGIDYAGQTAENVNIYNNNLYNNTLNGIDFKQLDRTNYPFNDDYTKIMEFINIYNNNIRNNGNNGINFQLEYADVNHNNMIVKNNNIKMGSVSNNSSIGIRVAMFNPLVYRAMIIDSNNIDCNEYLNGHGIRLSNTKYVSCINNKINKSMLAGIVVDHNDQFYSDYGVVSDSNELIDNTVLATNPSGNRRCIDSLLSGETVVTTNLLIKNNKLFNVGSGYLIQLNILNEATNINVGNEYIGSLFSTTPPIQSTKNVIYKSNNPIATGCVGWIGNSNSSNGDYKTYISIV